MKPDVSSRHRILLKVGTHIRFQKPTLRLKAAALLLIAGCGVHAVAQTPQPAAPATPAPQTEPPVPEGKTESGPGQPAEDKRVFGVLPNYRTAESSVPFQPITTKQKFTIATKDSFDYPVLLTTAFFAGLSQLEGDQNREYGQGVKGFAHRYSLSYVDQVVGNYFPEAIVPALFHLDPRYFRKGQGSVKSRFLYAVDRIFVCRNDSGGISFNANEFVGNSLAAAVSITYHPHERTVGDAATQAATYILTDMAGQLGKEFWPDIKRAYQRHRQKNTATP